MAADLQEQAVQVEWKAAKITAAALKGLIEQFLANRKKITHGEQSLKKLNLQGKKLESIELTGEDMQAFKRELNKYAVDFSIKKDTETQNYTVFFKGQDVDRVYKGLQKCVENFQKGSKKPIEIYVYIAISPIPIATFPSDDLNQIAKGFLKSFAAVCLQGAFIYLILSFFPILVSSNILGDTSAWGLLLYSLILALGVFSSSRWAKSVCNAM